MWKKLPDGVLTCSSCDNGAEANSVNETTPSEEVANDVQMPKKQDFWKNCESKKKKTLMLVLLGVLALAVVIGSIFIISGAVTEHKRNIKLGSIPDPEEFFGQIGKHEVDDGWFYKIEFDGGVIQDSQIRDYVSLLVYEYPFVLMDAEEHTSTGTSYREYDFAYNGTGKIIDPDTYQIRLIYSSLYTRIYIHDYTHFDICPIAASGSNQKEQITTDNMDDYVQTNPTVSNVPEATSAVVNGPTLPDPGAFLGGAQPFENWAQEISGWHLCYSTQIDDGWNAGHEYVQLLSDPRFNFTLRNSFSETGLYIKEDVYFFDYTGPESIEPARGRYYSFNDGIHDFSAAVCIKIQKNAQKNNTLITIDYSNDLKLQDLGDRASVIPSNPDGSLGSNDSGITFNSPNYNPDHTCLTCGGDGDCNECGGDGKVSRYNGQGKYIDSSCPRCHNGECSKCGGTGRRD